jgi:XTP/dITP diphosphohydrolase
LREAQQILALDLVHANLEGLFEIQTSCLDEVVRHKSSQAYEILKCPVMVEDSALIFSAWNGLPGALVKWFEKGVGCEGMLRMLEPFEDRSAKAICQVAVNDGKEIIVAKGEIAGTISRELKGSNGFGWDVIFIPDGESRTFAEMSADEKNAVSHRRKAFESLRDLL